jgi:hypothetical protein
VATSSNPVERVTRKSVKEGKGEKGAQKGRVDGVGDDPWEFFSLSTIINPDTLYLCTKADTNLKTLHQLHRLLLLFLLLLLLL